MKRLKSFVFLSALFVSTICVAQTLDQSILNKQDFQKTTNNTVTVTSHEKNDNHYIYSGGDGGTIDVFSLNKKGKLTPISSHKLLNAKGTARGIIAAHISGTDYLFVGNKGANTVEVFQINNAGSLKRVFVLNDTDETHIGTVITLQVIHMKESSYLFVGGLEKTPGLSSFKIHDNGSLTHVLSVQDDDKIHTDGIIGMYSHKIKGKTFLYTGGFQDNGISSFRIFENGRFENRMNIADNTTDRFLTGTYPVTGVSLKGKHYVIVGHRHHKYYKRGNFIKQKDFVYHGDGISVFKTNKKGELIPHFTLIDNEKTLLSGQTRIEILTVSKKEAIVAIATKDDESIQVCKLGKDGILTPISSLKTGYPIYYGLNALKIDEDLFFIAGSVKFSIKELNAYKLIPKSL